MIPAAPLETQVDLRERKSREKLAKMVITLLDHWQLSPADQAALLGLSSQSRSTVARYRKGEPLADSADLLSRACHLLGLANNGLLTQSAAEGWRTTERGDVAIDAGAYPLRAQE